MTELSRARFCHTSPSSSQLLARVLEQPELVQAVRRLPPEGLGLLIDRIGLEGASELIALATTEQLEQVFDQDLWIQRGANESEVFDAARFATWLEVMLEAGEAGVVERLCELPLDLVTLAVHRLVLVIDIEALAVEMSEGGRDADLLEKALDSCLCEEWEEFRLIAREPLAWDAVWTALIALDREHHERLRCILTHCSAMSSEYINDNGGLYQVLSSEEMLESDSLAERNDRRAARGYVSASDARSFLSLAQQGIHYFEGRDPITRAHFRELDRTMDGSVHAPTRSGGSQDSSTNELMSLVERIRDSAPAAGATGRDSDSSSDTIQGVHSRLLDRALAELALQQPKLHGERLEEFSYLANVMLASYARTEHQLRPVEATEAVLEVCDLGLVILMAALRHSVDAESQAAVLIVACVPADRLFRLAWPGAQLRMTVPTG